MSNRSRSRTRSRLPVAAPPPESTLLRWLQQHVLTGPVLISCDETNTASLKIIEAANGQWLDRRYHAGDDCWVRFYRLPPLR